MNEIKDTNAEQGSKKTSQKDARAERLRAQLRANLQKRKGQTRARIADAKEDQTD